MGKKSEEFIIQVQIFFNWTVALLELVTSQLRSAKSLCQALLKISRSPPLPYHLLIERGISGNFLVCYKQTQTLHSTSDLALLRFNIIVSNMPRHTKQSCSKKVKKSRVLTGNLKC